MNNIHHNAFVEIANFLRTAEFTSCIEECSMIFFHSAADGGYLSTNSIVLWIDKDNRIEVSLSEAEHSLLRSFLNPVKITADAE